MTPAQQAANYAAFAPKSINPLSAAFLAGYEAAEGAFAEWAAENNWTYWGRGTWLKRGGEEKTTPELIAIWKDSQK